MRYTKPIAELAVNSLNERQLEAHHLDDNFAAQDDAIATITRALFSAGGVAVPGSVTLTGTNLRVQGRVGVTLDATAAVHITDETLALATLAAGKGLVIIVPASATINRTYTDVVTGEPLTDVMNVSLGRLSVLGATEAGVSLDADGYPVCPANAVPVAQVTRTSGGATLDAVLSPPVQVNSSVTGPAGADGADGIDGISVTDAEINGSGHLILTLSDNSTIDAGVVSGGGGSGGGTDLAALPGYTADSVQTLQTDGAGGFLWVTVPLTWTYTYGTAPSGSYTDPSFTKLTDNVVGDLSTYGPSWVGWQGINPDIRLHASFAHNPGALDLHVLGNVGGGVELPLQITAYRSSDGGTTWVQAGQVAVAAAGWVSVPVSGVSRDWRLVVTRAQAGAWAMVSQFRVS